MEKTQEITSTVNARNAPENLIKGLGWGLIGGLAGTLVMDLTLMGVLASFGSPAITCFSIVGNTVARFFSMQNVEMARTIYWRIATHYVVGPM